MRLDSQPLDDTFALALEGNHEKMERLLTFVSDHLYDIGGF